MEEKSRKQLGFIDCLGIGISQIIGSGVMVLTGIVVGLTGRGTPVPSSWPPCWSSAR